MQVLSSAYPQLISMDSRYRSLLKCNESVGRVLDRQLLGAARGSGRVAASGGERRMRINGDVSSSEESK